MLLNFGGVPKIFESLLQKERDEACERAILARDNLQNGEVRPPEVSFSFCVVRCASNWDTVFNMKKYEND